MALQSSGAISLANIQTEFGGSNPISFGEYYKGGGLTTNYGSNPVATSGAITASSFYSTKKNPCPSNYSPNYGANRCDIITIPQVAVNYYLRCWAGGQNTALSCHNGNLYNNRNCGGSYQYCGSGLVRSNYTGYNVTGACWGEVGACAANNGNATWTGSCGSFTVTSCFGNDPSAVLTKAFSTL